MSQRLANTFVPANTAYRIGAPGEIIDIRRGGQHGYSPDYAAWLNATPYTSRPAIILALQEPLGMRKLPQPEKWIGAWRAMMETLPIRVEGLQNSWEVTVDDTPFGGGGAVFEVMTNVIESRPTLNFTYVERSGMPIHRFLKGWIGYLMMHPATKYALNNTRPGSELKDTLPDQYAGSIIVIEPDGNHRYVNQATLFTNVFPKGTGENQFKRDLSSGNEKREISVEFAGLHFQPPGLNDFAQALLDKLNIHGADVMRERSFITELSGTLLEQHFGYGASIDTIVKNQLA